MNTVKIAFPADFCFVPGVRMLVERTVLSFGFSERESYQIQTIVDEICNNAIEHGSKSSDTLVSLECQFDDNDFKVIVSDTGGKEFEPEKIMNINQKLMAEEQINLSIIERRGRGLIIVKKLSDQLQIDVGENGTVVKVMKKKSHKQE